MDAARRILSRAAESRHVPMYRSSFALIVTTVANAAFGLLFWVAAARLYPASVVGLGAGGISALQLVATVGWVGLQFTLLRYVPVAGSFARRLVSIVYGLGVGAALVVAVVFTTAFTGTLEVAFLSDGTAGAVAFCISVAVWVVFSLQDAVLVGLRRSLLVPVENAAYGALKLALLVALSGIDDPWILLGVWAGGAGVLAAVVNGLIYGRLLAAHVPSEVPLSRSGLAWFSAGQTGVALLSWVPDFLVPLLVLAYLDEAANAYYYAAWTIGFSARLLAVNIGNAMTAEGAYGGNPAGRLLRMVARLCVIVLAPTIAALMLAAEPILRIFGERYAEEGTALLRYFSLGLVPFTIATVVIAYERVRERFGAALLITGAGTVATIGLDLVLLPAQGISGAGLGWLAGQSLAAIIAVATLRGMRGSEAGYRPAPGQVPEAG